MNGHIGHVLLNRYIGTSLLTKHDNIVSLHVWNIFLNIELCLPNSHITSFSLLKN